MPEIPVPIGVRREGRAITSQAAGPRTGEGLDLVTVVDLTQAWSPATVTMAVVIAVGTQRRQRQMERLAGTQDLQADKGRVMSRPHQQALFQQGIGDGMAPDRQASIEMKRFEIQIAVRRHRAVTELHESPAGIRSPHT